MDLFCYIWISSAIPSMPDLYDAPPVSSTYRRKFNTVSTRLQVSNSVRLGVPLGAAWADRGLSGLALPGVTSWLTPQHQPITGQVFRDHRQIRSFGAARKSALQSVATLVPISAPLVRNHWSAARDRSLSPEVRVRAV
jgi:hypothetical protein